MLNRGRPPHTDQEMIEDIHDMMGDEGESILTTYAQLRATGMRPEDAAISAMNAYLEASRRILAGLLGRN